MKILTVDDRNSDKDLDALGWESQPVMDDSGILCHLIKLWLLFLVES